MSPRPLAGRTVLDAGAATGAASSALTAQRAAVLAVDLSAGMLAWSAATRPPCAVADIRALPLAGGSVDDVVAAFVLNHLAEPVAGLSELSPYLELTARFRGEPVRVDAVPGKLCGDESQR